MKVPGLLRFQLIATPVDNDPVGNLDTGIRMTLLPVECGKLAIRYRVAIVGTAPPSLRMTK